MKITLLSFLVILTSMCLVSGQDKKKEKPKAYTDPAKVTDTDFKIQGEYVGEVDGGKWGVQIIALGNGKFSFKAYPGGLPGDGWGGDQASMMKGDGVRTGDGAVLTVKNGGAKALVKDGLVKIVVKETNQELGKLKRVERKSVTLGKKAPEGAITLFDGSNADAWKDGKMDNDLLTQGTTSKQTFQDFHLHMEFRTPYMPTARGQGRGNSGFYAQGRYEVQILDSFGLEGKDNECGGIYSVGPPKLNMCYPPLSWQTYDVDFTAAKYDADGKKTDDARLTVRHNGVLIHDDQVADHSTTASPLKEGPEAGPIFFQNHGNPVRFRNVWVIEKKY